MEEAFKGRVLLGLSLVSLIFIVSTVASCSKVGQLQKVRQQENERRFDAEANLDKLTKNMSANDQKLATLAQDLDSAKTELDTVKKTLLQEQLVNQSLKEELAKVNKLKETLEENLKEALVANKISLTPKPKK